MQRISLDDLDATDFFDADDFDTLPSGWRGCVGGPNLWSEQEQLQREMLSKMVADAERYASVISKRDVSAHLINNGSVPAFSSASSITFVAEKIGLLTEPHEVAGVKGLTLHEVAHIMFTPRSQTPFAQWAINNAKLAYRVAEDARIEHLFLGRFGSFVSPWLIASCLRFLLADETHIVAAYPVIVGRKYLPLEVRQAVRNAYLFPADASAIQSLINRYRVLVFDSQEAVDEAKLVLAELQVLLEKLPLMQDPNGHEQRSDSELETSISRPLAADEQNKAKATADKRGFKDTTDISEQTQVDKDTKQKLEQYGQKAELLPPNQEGDDPANGTGENDSNSEESSSVSGLTKNGDAKNTLDPAVKAEFAKLFDRILDENRAEIASDIKSWAKQQEIQGGIVKPIEKHYYSDSVLDNTTHLMAKKFGQQLQELRLQHEPGWDKRVSSGRINAGRLLRGADLDEAFDRFDEGRDDATEIECVILLDKSGSMGGANADAAYRAMYAVKKGLQALQANTTVVLFDHYTYLLYEAKDKVNNSVRDAGASGGTDATGAVNHARSLLASSSKAVKMLLMITDGEWGQTPRIDLEIMELRNSGVLTAFCMIGDSFSDSTHNAEISLQIKSAKDILALAKGLVKLAIKRQLTKY
jgi:hypothetical protein